MTEKPRVRHGTVTRIDRDDAVDLTLGDGRVITISRTDRRGRLRITSGEPIKAKRRRRAATPRQP